MPEPHHDKAAPSDSPGDADASSERRGSDAALERMRLADVRAHLAAIVESTDDAIISKSLNGTILSWNRGAVQLYGYPPQDMIGGPISVLAPPERQDEIAGILARI